MCHSKPLFSDASCHGDRAEFQFQLQIEEQNLGILEILGLLLEAGVTKTFLERHPINQHRIGHRPPRDLLDAHAYIEFEFSVLVRI